MKFKVKIKCDNDAFRGGPEEVVRILREVANRIAADGERAGKISDYNGNRVGSYGFGLDKEGK